MVVIGFVDDLVTDSSASHVMDSVVDFVVGPVARPGSGPGPGPAVELLVEPALELVVEPLLHTLVQPVVLQLVVLTIGVLHERQPPCHIVGCSIHHRGPSSFPP